MSVHRNIGTLNTPDTLTSRFAKFVTQTPSHALDEAVTQAASRALTDTLGVGLGGREDHASGIAAQWVAAMGGAPQATLWGRAERASAADAAFLNAIQAHVLDYDDSSLNLRGHPSAILVSVALAVGEAMNASGADVLAAYAIGLEVSAKLSPALGPDHYFRGWHTSSTVGIFGATAVAARLIGLDEMQLRHAWGIAASQAAGLTRNFGTMTKALHIGNAARNGIVAAQLAKGGFTGDMDIFEGKGGFVDVYTGFKPAVPSPQPASHARGEGELKLEAQVERLGNPWELLDPGLYVKRWPCCYASHRPIAGMLDMIARHKLAAEDIERVDVGFLPGQTHPLNHRRPRNELEAKFSIEYPIAAAILDRRVGLDSFADDQVERPAAQALMEKVGRFSIPDEKTYNGLSGYNVIRISTRGATIEEKITGTPGAPYEPMTDEDRREKFVSCALRVMPREKAEALYAKAAGLASLRSVRNLWA
jgi:2-methylcitrate dehydratase PrpD